MPRRLSEEDRAVWDRVARSARRLHNQLHGAVPEVPVAEPMAAAATPEVPRTSPAPRTLRPHGKPGRPEPSVRLDLALPLDQALAAAPIRMDAGVHRRLARGQLVPEARIDLHGMTREQARQALTGFLMSAHARGVRLVLAITGKGGRAVDDDLAPLIRRPGAIRHDLPHWLSSPPLRPLVLDLRPAHRTHGGTGAFYIYLRRAR